MRLWLKTNTVFILIATSTVATWLALLVNDQTILMPNLTGGPILAPMPAQIFLTLVPVVNLAMIFGRSLEVPMILSRRKLALLNVSLVLMALLAATSVLAGENIWQPAQWVLLQNLMLFIGLQFALMRFVTIKMASIAPTIWILICALYGHDFQAGGFQVWAFAIDQQASQVGWSTSIFIFCLGCALHLSTSTSRKFKLYNLGK